MSDRNHEFRFQQQQQRIARKIGAARSLDFFNALTGPELLQSTERLLPEHRERLYPPTVTLAMFMGQALNEDGSCQKAVNGWAAQRAAEGLGAMSIRTGGYCRARYRLPVEMIEGLTRESARVLSTRSPATWGWRGRAVKLIDGTGISMPDTPENQARFPQPSTQAEGVGFPLARVVAAICLSSGAVLDAAMGPFEGKGHSELDLLRQLRGALCAGDVMLADSFYCHYFLVASLQAAGIDAVFEQFAPRHSDFRRGKKLGVRDHVVRWSKPKIRPHWMSPEDYASFDDEITVREVKVDGRVLVTTMLNARAVRKAELFRLYRMRWHVELDLRNIKTTLGMNLLSCNTPQMNEKEMWIHLLAYNLVRLLMAQAACLADRHPRQLSFKHTAQLWTEWAVRRLLGRPQCQRTLLALIAQIEVGNRPDRIEPRARKRRPKPYPWLKVPRAEARRQLRIYGHLLQA